MLGQANHLSDLAEERSFQGRAMPILLEEVPVQSVPDSFFEGSSSGSCVAALTFLGVGFFDVGLMVMLGHLDKLADCCYTNGAFSREDLIELFKSRLKACAPHQQLKGKYSLHNTRLFSLVSLVTNNLAYRNLRRQNSYRF